MTKWRLAVCMAPGLINCKSWDFKSYRTKDECHAAARAIQAQRQKNVIVMCMETIIKKRKKDGGSGSIGTQKGVQ